MMKKIFAGFAAAALTLQTPAAAEPVSGAGTGELDALIVDLKAQNAAGALERLNSETDAMEEEAIKNRALLGKDYIEKAILKVRLQELGMLLLFPTLPITVADQCYIRDFGLYSGPRYTAFLNELTTIRRDRQNGQAFQLSNEKFQSAVKRYYAEDIQARTDIRDHCATAYPEQPRP